MKYEVGQKLIAKDMDGNEFIIEIINHRGDFYDYVIIDKQNAYDSDSKYFYIDSPFAKKIRLYGSPVAPGDLGQLARDADSIAIDLHALSGRRKTVTVRDSDQTRRNKFAKELADALGKEYYIDMDYYTGYKTVGVRGCCTVYAKFPDFTIHVEEREFLDRIVDFASKQIDDPFEYAIINYGE